MRVYHGSGIVIREPNYEHKNPDTDYGSGFYTTEDIEMGKLWAVENGGETPTVSAYDLKVHGLNVLNLDVYGTLVWAAEVIAHRGVKDISVKKIAEEFASKYKMNTEEYDLIIGYRADDGYVDIEESFLKGLFSVQEMDGLFREGELGMQVVLKSRKAYEQIKFVEPPIYVKEGTYDKYYEAKITEKVQSIIEERTYAVSVQNYKPEGLMISDVLRFYYEYNSTKNEYVKMDCNKEYRLLDIPLRED